MKPVSTITIEQSNNGYFVARYRRYNEQETTVAVYPDYDVEHLLLLVARHLTQKDGVVDETRVLTYAPPPPPLAEVAKRRSKGWARGRKG